MFVRLPWYIIRSTDLFISMYIYSHAGGQGVYAAFDAVSGELTQKVVHSLRRGGTVYVYGSLSGNNFGPIDAVELRGSGKTIAGWALGNWFGALSPESQAEKVQSVLDLLADGVIAPFSGEYLEPSATLLRHL